MSIHPHDGSDLVTLHRLDVEYLAHLLDRVEDWLRHAGHDARDDLAEFSTSRQRPPRRRRPHHQPRRPHRCPAPPAQGRDLMTRSTTPAAPPIPDELDRLLRRMRLTKGDSHRLAEALAGKGVTPLT